ncbi:MarR family transcriptional regulator, partial [Enterococcus faecalis]|uniref:MarR family transcriptional regulator n=1 Tax=Enterococcus faecalis TaxID=1351 RepID=UPI00403F371B
MKRGSNIVGVGAYNERLVLALIRRHGAMSKAELAKRTGLSRQTLTDVVGRLEDEGKLRREEPRRGKIG